MNNGRTLMARKDVERSIVTGLMALGLISSAWAQDVGTPSKEEIEKALPKPPYSPYANRDFPTRPVLRRHASPHLVLHGCRRLRGAARAEGGLPLRQGRATDRLQRPAGEALPPARLPRGRGPLRQHGLLPGPVCGQARGARRPDGTPVVRPDPVRQGRGGRPPDHRRLLAGDVPQGSHVHARDAGPIAAPGRRRLPPPSSTTSRAASPPSSATNGPPTPAATTCTATSSSATTATGRARSSRSPCIRRSGATTRRSLEVDASLRAEDRRQRAGHRAQRQSQQRPDVPRSSRPSARRSTGSMPSSGHDGNGSTRPRRPRATARRIRSCRRTTSSPTSSAGTSAISTPASRRPGRCSNSSMPARR